ncbi:unnamed protein product [Cyprideis torosa]|uniref:Uncharacterized protein n=1 Tax=Cyprideis torosa TaxID=163714 RepID=A0A7R8WW80_9CRUS|nr:unnamed protein product [Cyprideis torosa]CAG0908117.1 unnamed protein product [Cyprideis torosa]
MPRWVDHGVDEYQRRLPGWLGFTLRDVPLGQRSGKADPLRATADEGERQLKAIGRDTRVVAFERTGKAIDSEGLAVWIDELRNDACDGSLLVGGPEGLAPACFERADAIWSISAMTLAHPVVKVLLLEQIYRACAILDGSPYHRGQSTLR